MPAGNRKRGALIAQVSARRWADSVRHKIFAPRCSRTDCVAKAPIWRRAQMTRIDGGWLCSPRCLEAEAHDRFVVMSVPKQPTTSHRVPLGLLMLSRGYLQEEQLQVVLSAQRQAREGKVGAWALKLNFATERQVLTALSLQWSCPVLALQMPPDPSCPEMLPWRLLQSLRMMPVRFIASTGLLYMALSEGVDHGALAAIEQMLHCQVVPCLVSDRTMDGWLSRESVYTSPRVQLFDKPSGAAEMARITASYAGRLSADRVQMKQCGQYAWVRLASKGNGTDLLFDLHQCRQDTFFGPREALVTAV
jgi:hypothetical protein